MDVSTITQEIGPVDQALELEYNLRIRHPERTAVYERYAQRSAAFRASAPGFSAVPYAAAQNCVLDFFPAPRAGRRAPLLFFVHGGYWRALERSIFSFLAQAWLDQGIHVAMPGYTLAPEVPVAHIVDEVGMAMKLLCDQSEAWGIDVSRMLISGHSAGAHLGANVLRTSCKQAAGFVGVSGLYDLEPLLSTTINHDVHLDATSALALSPAHQSVTANVRYLCAVGEAETDGFKGQSRNYVAHLRSGQADARYMAVPGRTHFDILEDLADPTAALFKVANGLLGRS